MHVIYKDFSTLSGEASLSPNRPNGLKVKTQITLAISNGFETWFGD